MRVVLQTVGTRGDIQPILALSVGLKKKGHDVCLVAPVNYRDFVESYHIEFCPIRADVKALLASPRGKQVIESGNVFRFASFRHDISRHYEQAAFAAYEASVNADIIVYINSFPLGYSIAEKLGIPCLEIALQPLTPTRKHPPVTLLHQGSKGPLLNLLMTKFVNRAYWEVSRKTVNNIRKELGLEPFGMFSAYDRQKKYHVPLIYAFSPTVMKKPEDWPDNVDITGYLFLEGRDHWKPTEQFRRFLAAGEKPVYIGFGSMTSSNIKQELEMISKALRLCGQRGVLLSGWRNIGKGMKLPDNIYITKSAPHDKLFPLMSAVVHHGGAGTTSAALRAGVPSVVVPHFADQPFWGYQLFKNGIGAKPIPLKKLTAERLAEAIKSVVNDASVQKKAAETGENIRMETGIENAIRIIERLAAAKQAKQDHLLDLNKFEIVD